jgi:hypothetical protein
MKTLNMESYRIGLNNGKYLKDAIKKYLMKIVHWKEIL